MGYWIQEHKVRKKMEFKSSCKSYKEFYLEVNN
jgi:hypothetical protein